MEELSMNKTLLLLGTLALLFAAVGCVKQNVPAPKPDNGPAQAACAAPEAARS
jgi:hypothetical protein